MYDQIVSDVGVASDFIDAARSGDVEGMTEAVAGKGIEVGIGLLPLARFKLPVRAPATPRPATPAKVTPSATQDAGGGTATVRWDLTLVQMGMPRCGWRGRVSRRWKLNKLFRVWERKKNPQGRATTSDFAEPLTGKNVVERTFHLPDARAARRAQLEAIGKDLGAYDGLRNSCVTYCVSILRAGGVTSVREGVRGVIDLRRML